MALKRRDFIISLLGSLAGLAVSGRDGWPLVRRRTGPDGLGSEISHLFSNLENVRIVGNRYLAQYPERADRDAIIAELGLPPLESGDNNRGYLKKWADESLRRDFMVGDSVIVNNWILSRTEVNLCALMALS